MSLINAYPNLYAAIRRGSIERDPFFLLIEEVIDYSLRYHNLHDWIPPVNLDVARSMNEFTYFNENFAATVVRPETEEQAMRLANRLGFDEGRWLEFVDHENSRRDHKWYLLNIYHYNQPYLFQMFSFACYASRIALQRNRHSLANDVVWALLAALREILPSEEYYREFYFVANVYNNQHIDNQPYDVDEGIGDIVDEDNSSRGNYRSLSLIHGDPILLFVEELIDYSLRYDNLHDWIPAIDLGTLRRTEMRYFTENLGRAITHFCIVDNAVHVAQQLGFNEERWLELYRPPEARNFQNYFLRQVLHFYGNRNEFLMFSFACYSSKLAIRRNRNSLVNEVVSALVHFLHQYYPHQQHYREFDYWACGYNGLHLHQSSDDDGVESEENEDVGPEENNEADFSEEEAASHSDGEQNETEESDSQSSTEGKEGSGSNASEGKNGSDASEGKNGSDASEESGWDASEEESGWDASEEESGWDASEEESGWDASEEESGMHTLEEESGMHTLEEEWIEYFRRK